ncbi:MAG TPA: efflux RND transporter periplasmic adaptor subunit [Polyangiaceae bacterium]|jgi:HlyD family secretion protein|nr:efflux RND transporter periplasmic adaptor subunit [Polyangiaceae bacterium]
MTTVSREADGAPAAGGSRSTEAAGGSDAKRARARLRARRLKQWFGFSALAVVLGAGAFFGYRYWRKSRIPKIHYETAALDRGHIAAKVTATGTLSALVTVLVGSQVSGRIESMKADWNSIVTKGEVIAQIEPSLFKAAVEQAHANYVSALADVDKSNAQALDADRQYERSKILMGQKLIAQADFETAEANSNVAKAQVASSKAEVEQALASLHQAQVNLKYTTIYSPIDGVVISRSVDVGQTVAASLQAPTLFTIAQDLTKMQVDTSVAEGDVGKLRESMPVSFTVDAYPAERFVGTVRQVRDAPTTVQNVVTYDAVIDVDNSRKLLKPGMTANVTFVHAEKDDVIRVPNAALRFRPDGDILKALGPDGNGAPPQMKPNERALWILHGRRPSRAIIVPGITDGSFTELVSGDAKPGDAAITEVIGASATTGKAAPASTSRMPFGGARAASGSRRM